MRYLVWICVTLAAQCTAYNVLVIFPFPVGSHGTIGRGVVRHLLKAGHETIIYVMWYLVRICAMLAVQCTAYNVLVVFPFPAGSHNIIGRGMVRHLLQAGHEVTYITPFITNNSHPSFRQIDVTDNFNAFDVNLVNIQALVNKATYFDPDKIFQLMINITKRTIENENVLNLLHDPNEKFDVVISQWMFNEVVSGFATIYSCPHIWFNLHEPTFAVLSVIDEALNPAYTASVELSFVPPFTFWQRLQSLYFQIDWMLRYYLSYRSIEKEVFNKAFGPIMARRNKRLPDYEEVRLNSSLMFGNYHVSMGQAFRLPQNYICVGGQHINEDVTPLPEDINKIMEESENGVIYFSMGSNLKSKDLPYSIKQSLLKMFAGLKYTVIWKFEDKLPSLPKNVHILPWAPQQSILSHPRCILFISHGGLLSTMEAVHFAVPLVGIPVYFDQQLNVERAVIKGIAIKVDLNEQVPEHLKSAIHEILANSEYQERMNVISYVYHHRPTPPGKELVHWVEHVIRTGGALHLRSPALLMPWYQKLYLDLVLMLLLLTAFVVYCMKICLSQQLKKSKLKKS